MSDDLKRQLIQVLEKKNESLRQTYARLDAYLQEINAITADIVDFVRDTGITARKINTGASIGFYDKTVPYQSGVELRMGTSSFQITSVINSGGPEPLHSLFGIEVSGSRIPSIFSSSRIAYFDSGIHRWTIAESVMGTPDGIAISGREITHDDIKRAIIEVFK